VKRGKRGQGLPLNTVIVAILVVLVLVVIVAFFLGGTGGITQTVQRIFFGVTAGTDIDVASRTCEQYCQQAKGSSVNVIDSAFCKKTFAIDWDFDGEADFCAGNPEKRAKFHCWDSLKLNVFCEDVTCRSDLNPDLTYCQTN